MQLRTKRFFYFSFLGSLLLVIHPPPIHRHHLQDPEFWLPHRPQAAPTARSCPQHRRRVLVNNSNNSNNNNSNNRRRLSCCVPLSLGLQDESAFPELPEKATGGIGLWPEESFTLCTLLSVERRRRSWSPRPTRPLCSVWKESTCELMF